MVKIVKTLKTTLKGVLSASGTSFTVQKFVDHKGNEIDYTDFDGQFAVVIEQGTKIEIVLIDGITQSSTDDTATLSIATNGRHLDATSPYAGGSSGLDFTTGASVIVSNDPYTLSLFAHSKNDNAFEGDNSFTNFPTKIGSLIATSNDEFMTYGHALSLLTGSANIDQVVHEGVAGENLTSGEVVYFKESDQRWWKASASAVATSQGVKLGIAQEIVLAGASVRVFTGGIEKNQAGMTGGQKMYLADTAGDISSTAGTIEVFVGWAIDATTLLWAHNEDVQTLTADEKDALQTTLALSTNNKVLDEASASNGAIYTASTIAFVDSNPDTLTDSANGFVTAGFQQGQQITVSGSASNDGTYRIKSVTAGTITLIATDSLSAESAGATVTLSAVKAGKVVRFNSDGEISGVGGKVEYQAGEEISAGQPVKLYNASGTLKLKGLEGFVVDADGSFAQNSVTEFNSATTSDIKVIRIGTKAVVAFVDTGDSSKGKVMVADIASGNFTFGSETTFNGASTASQPVLKKISATQFLLVWRDTSAGTTKAIIGTISGTTVSFGSAVTVASKNVSAIALAVRGAKCIVSYVDTTDSNKLKAVAGDIDVSGLTVTFGSETTANTGSNDTGEYKDSVFFLTSSLIGITFSDTNEVKAVVATLSGTTLTFGSSVTGLSGCNGGGAGAPLTASSFVVASGKSASYSGGQARVATVSGTTITFGTTTNIPNGSDDVRTGNDSCAVEKVSATQFAFFYRQGAGTYYYKVLICDVSGTTITAGTPYALTHLGTGVVVEHFAMDTSKPSELIVAYRDNGDYGEILTVEPTVLSNDFASLLGTPDSDTSTGSMAKVAVGNSITSSGHSGLTLGEMYYLQEDLSISNSVTDYPFGVAISTTEIMVLR